MGAKDIELKAIDSRTANDLVRRVHYSRSVVRNSQLHIGVFYKGRLEGAMQFGPSLDKRKIQGLVKETPWNGFIELNRMAFTEALPKNSESRAISVAMRLLRQHASHIQWVVSFADGAQCGDGTIYRASGFVLTGIKANDQVWVGPDGQTVSRMTVTKGKHLTTGAASMSGFQEKGFKPINGHQLRYVYFLDPAARQRLAVPALPFSEITKRGAGMYRGKLRAGSSASGTSPVQGGGGGANPTPALSTVKIGG